MIAKIPEKNKQQGVCYALTDDGVELPVIDITNPAFSENASQAKLAELCQDYLHFQKSPDFVMVGSIVLDADIPHIIQATSKMALRTFKPEDFKTLAESLGWTCGRIIEGNPIYQVASLKKANA